MNIETAQAVCQTMRIGCTTETLTIENYWMGIHQETDREIHRAAALNKRLREAMERNAGYASSGNGYGAGTHRETPESVRLWFLDTPLGPVLAGAPAVPARKAVCACSRFHPGKRSGKQIPCANI